MQLAGLLSDDFLWLLKKPHYQAIFIKWWIMCIMIFIQMYIDILSFSFNLNDDLSPQYNLSLMRYLHELYWKIITPLLQLYMGPSIAMKYRHLLDKGWKCSPSLAAAQKLFYAFHWFTFRRALFDWSQCVLSANQRFCLQLHTKVVVPEMWSDAISLQEG